MSLDDLTTIILAREQARCDALLANDQGALGSLLSERLHFVHANATKDTKASLLTKLASGNVVYRSLVVDETHVLPAGPGAALLAARLTADVFVRGEPKVICNLALSAWVQEDGVWRLLAYQPTALA